MLQATNLWLSTRSPVVTPAIPKYPKTVILFGNHCCLFSSVSQSCPTLCEPMDYSLPGFPFYHQPLSLLKLMSVMSSTYLILCHPLLLLPSIFSSTRFFSNESALSIKWPKYWSFSFSISPSNEYSGWISFRIDWLDLFAVQRTLKSLLQHQFESITSSPLSFLFFLI